jgi:hypothetical protein
MHLVKVAHDFDSLRGILFVIICYHADARVIQFLGIGFQMLTRRWKPREDIQHCRAKLLHFILIRLHGISGQDISQRPKQMTQKSREIRRVHNINALIDVSHSLQTIEVSMKQGRI